MMIMSYGFDSDSCRFDFKRCLFEFKGREFMLYSGDMRNCDSFDTVVQDDADADKAFELIHEFLYLFGWTNGCAFHFVGASGFGPGNRDVMLKRTAPVFRCPRGFWYNRTNMLIMADPNCSEDFIKAMSLYNDALYCNDNFYRFLCLYKILDLPVNGQTRNPVDWIDSNLQCYTPNVHTQKWIPHNKDLSSFLQDECRNAISHIHRKDPNKSSVISYSAKDYEKISLACSIIMPFVRWLVEKEIGVPQSKAVNVIFQDD